ncbi:hypothetical protein CL616_03650 [archaeon]|nr:hypothetical protein [archaeon]|tara:strand:+ start:4798 stop:5442 length:645 start_codon:yes stop_codon:yes gene_type:complete
MKRGQASAFIIMGLIIVVIVILFFMNTFKISSSNEITEIKNIDQAQELIENCIEETINDAFYTQGKQGGQLKLQNYSPIFTTTYDLLTIEQMENNLNEYLETKIPECSSFLENTEFTLQNNPIQVTSSFDNEVNIQVSWPAKIIYLDKQQLVSEVQVSYLIDFISLYQTITLFYEAFQLEQTDFIVNIFSNYEESLIEITDLETQYQFRIVKII